MQTEWWGKESLRYVKTYLDQDIGNAYHGYFSESIEQPPKSILDVGCGNGTFLSGLCNLFTSHGTGVEPSPEAVEILKSKFKNKANLNFLAAKAHNLPLESNSFDLVVCWSVLHWIGRQWYLQSLGEMIRVTKLHLAVMDFYTTIPYRVVYKYDNRAFTFKTDFDNLILSTGIMEKVAEFYWTSDNGKKVSIEKGDFSPFEHNPNNYHGRKMVLYRKNLDLLPIYTQEDFA